MLKRTRHPFYDLPIFWEILLVGAIVVTGVLFWETSGIHDSPFPLLIHRLSGIGLILILWGTCIEPYLLIVQTRRIVLPASPPLRIAIIGDIHVGPYHGRAFVEKIVQKTNDLDADIIFLVGDLIDHERSLLSDLQPLKKLHARHGIFAITGNHDAGHYIDWRKRPYIIQDRTQDIDALLTSFGFTFLRNRSHVISVKGKPLAIAGIDDILMPSCDLEKALTGIAHDTPVILLSHTPDIILNNKSHRADLIISGHTHGGQIRLPFIGSLAPIPDRLGRKYDRGLFAIGKKTTLAITQGTGLSGVRSRLFCPPEILVLEVSG